MRAERVSMFQVTFAFGATVVLTLSLLERLTAWAGKKETFVDEVAQPKTPTRQRNDVVSPEAFNSAFSNPVLR